MDASLSVFGWLDALKFNRFHRQLVIVGSLICALGGYNSQIIAYIVPLALKEWQLTPLEAGTMISYGFLGLMFGAAGFGMLSDRLGRKKTTILIVIVLCVFNAAAAFAPSFRVFCLLRFLSGLGIGGVVPLTITLVSEFSPSGIRARLLTIVGGSFTIGWALAGLFAMFLVPYFGWRSVLLVAIAPLFLLPFLRSYLPESIRFLANRNRYDDSIEEIRRIERIAGLEPRGWEPANFAQDVALRGSGVKELLQPGLRTMTILVWCTYFFCMLALYGLSTWLPSILANSGFSLIRSYSYTVVQSLGAALGGFLLGWFMDTVGRKAGLCLSFLLGGLSVLLFGAVSSDASLLLAGLATGIFLVGIPSALHVVANEIYPTRVRATGAGWAYAVGRVGSIAGPVIGGVVQMAGFTFNQFFVVFSLPSFLCVLLVALYPVGVKREGLEAVAAKLLKQG
ncbi:MAG: hypothetical protein CVU57_17225 [Deltaproteobacteria bacterium HGW-Deltaproteobacteria-15]|jgi:benzoate transport|nr:MAG: hypothetical protein CVU57_17225 [Deltaproteobacteria bacterium HGW-Deltaproteobacteria-15]